MKKEKRKSRSSSLKRLKKLGKEKEKREHTNKLIANSNIDNDVNAGGEIESPSNIYSKVYKSKNYKLESNYLERIKDIDSKDLHKYFYNVNRELENYFKEKKLNEIRELENLEKGLIDGFYKKKYKRQIKELKRSL